MKTDLKLSEPYEPGALEALANQFGSPLFVIDRERLLARQIGAYTMACTTDFNFFPRAKVIAVNVERGPAS